MTQSPVFDKYARYYDLLYRDKDYQAEVGYLTRLIRRFHLGAKSILELGSGTGKHAHLLAGQSFMVHGIERSPEMLAQSLNTTAIVKQDSGMEQLVFSQGDIRTVRLNEHFDSVISLFHVISYQTTNGDVTAAFETAREHLNPGGIFIFDVWYGPAVLTDRPTVRIKRMADDEIEVTRIAEPVMHLNQNRVDVNYHVFIRNKGTGAVKELQESHAMRYFFRPEIDLLSNISGFQCLNVEEWMTGNKIGCNTWGACFLLQAV